MTRRRLPLTKSLDLHDRTKAVYMNSFSTAGRLVFSARSYRALGIGSTGLFLIVYLMTLPSAFTGGRVGFIAFQFLNWELTVIATLMALLMGLLLPFMVFLFRQGQKASKAAASGGVIAGIVTPILCCSPLLPLALSFVASFSPSLIGAFGWKIQGFIATHQTELYAGAILLLGLAIYQNARVICRGPSCALP